MHVPARQPPGPASPVATAFAISSSWRYIVSVLIHACVLLYVTEASCLQSRLCRPGCASVRHIERKDKLRHARGLLSDSTEDDASTGDGLLQETYDAARRITDVALQQVLDTLQQKATALSGQSASITATYNAVTKPTQLIAQTAVLKVSGSQASMSQAFHSARPQLQYETSQAAAITQAAARQAAAQQHQAMISTSTGSTDSMVSWVNQQQLPVAVKPNTVYIDHTTSSNTNTQTSELPVVTSAGPGGITISTSTPINIVNPIQTQQTGFGSGSLLEAFLRRPRIIIVPVFLG